MDFYTCKCNVTSNKTVVAEDMFLTKDIPTTAGSKMLDGYVSLFEAEVLTRLKNAGFDLLGKATVGEFAIDLLGETAYSNPPIADGKIKSPVAEILKAGDTDACIVFDVNGAPRRAAAQNDMVCVKPTYGTVSRYGTIPVACSGETVSVMAKDADNCADVLAVISGYDAKDGTSVDKAFSKEDADIKKVAVLKSMKEGIDGAVADKFSTFCDNLSAKGIEVCEVDDEVIHLARAAWNVLMCAELCNNVSRYDGVKYGYRTSDFTTIEDIYTNSRTETFGELLKAAILYGSDSLSTENYMKQYDKALRIRRVICAEFNKLFAEYDGVLMPAVSKMEYNADENKHFVFEENFYTAPASITGLPVVVAGGVQMVGSAYSENKLFKIAKEGGRA